MKNTWTGLPVGSMLARRISGYTCIHLNYGCFSLQRACNSSNPRATGVTLIYVASYPIEPGYISIDTCTEMFLPARSCQGTWPYRSAPACFTLISLQGAPDDSHKSNTAATLKEATRANAAAGSSHVTSCSGHRCTRPRGHMTHLLPWIGQDGSWHWLWSTLERN